MGDRTYSYQLAVAAERNVKEEEYWLDKLSGELTKSNFPYDYQKKDVDDRLIKTEAFSFPDTLASGLMKISKGSSVDVKLHMLLVTGLFLLLNKYTGSNDIIIGSPLVKQEIESEFINSFLVFRNELNDHMSFKDLLLQVRETIIQAIKHQNYPLELLIQRLDLPNKGDEFPLFDVVVSLENIYDKCFIQDIHYNIGFFFLRTGESIEGFVEYNSSLYRERLIKQIIRHYMELLKQAISDVNVKLTDIDMLLEEERNQILFDFNNKKIQSPQDKTIVDIFEKQVEKTPDHDACFEKDKFLTYRDLNHKANILAKIIKEILE